MEEDNVVKGGLTTKLLEVMTPSTWTMALIISILLVFGGISVARSDDGITVKGDVVKEAEVVVDEKEVGWLIKQLQGSKDYLREAYNRATQEDADAVESPIDSTEATKTPDVSVEATVPVLKVKVPKVSVESIPTPIAEPIGSTTSKSVGEAIVFLDKEEKAHLKKPIMLSNEHNA